jgi:hypothetical protein
MQSLLILSSLSILSTLEEEMLVRTLRVEIIQN